MKKRSDFVVFVYLRRFISSLSRLGPARLIARLGSGLSDHSLCDGCKATLAKCCRGFSTVFACILRIPILNSIIRLPVKIWSVVTLKHQQTPVVVKYKDFAPYVVSIKQENARYKLGLVLVLTLASFTVVHLKHPQWFSGIAPKGYIAKIRVNGQITNGVIDEYLAKVTPKVIKEKKILAVIIDIDSPGGDIYASESIYRNIRKIAAAKTTVASVRSMAASGGYMAALGCDKIFALDTSLIGSIGAFTATRNVAKLLDKLGVEIRMYRSTQGKASPGMFDKSAPQFAHDRMQEHAVKMGTYFVDLVKARRNFTKAEMNSVSDGRVFLGYHALSKKLIDGIADEAEIVDMLVDWGVVQKKTKVIDINPPRKQQQSSPKNMFLRLLSNVAVKFLNTVPDDNLLDINPTPSLNSRLEYVDGITN